MQQFCFLKKPQPMDFPKGKSIGWGGEKSPTFGLQNLKTMKHLTLGERYEISTLLNLGYSKNEIADRLGRNRSTMYRELSRNADKRDKSYKSELAQRKSKYRHRIKPKKLVFTEEVKAHVSNELASDLSPDQITGRAVKLNIPL